MAGMKKVRKTSPRRKGATRVFTFDELSPYVHTPEYFLASTADRDNESKIAELADKYKIPRREVRDIISTPFSFLDAIRLSKSGTYYEEDFPCVALPTFGKIMSMPHFIRGRRERELKKLEDV